SLGRTGCRGRRASDRHPATPRPRHNQPRRRFRGERVPVRILCGRRRARHHHLWRLARVAGKPGARYHLMLWAQPVLLDLVNGFSPAEFVTLLGEVFERAPWVAEAVAPLPPFATVT